MNFASGIFRYRIVYSTEQVFHFRRIHIDISSNKTEGASGNCGIFFFLLFKTKNLFPLQHVNLCGILFYRFRFFLNFDCFSNPALLTESTKLTCDQKHLIAYFFWNIERRLIFQIWVKMKLSIIVCVLCIWSSHDCFGKTICQCLPAWWISI